jgi:hypothetical protein
VIGCFVVFGASSIVSGIRDASSIATETAPAYSPLPPPPAPVAVVMPMSSRPAGPAPSTPANDPFAGASVPRP